MALKNDQLTSEASAKVTEAEFRTLAETITAGIFIYQGTKMQYVNSAAECISGYTREELLAMDFWEIIHPEFQALVKERGLARQRGENVPIRYEVKILAKNGESRWVDFTATLTEFEGKPAVLGTALDITVRKQAEEALQQSEARYRTLVENLPDAIYVHRDGKVLYANPASARLIGASHPQQLIGKSVIDFVAAEHRPLVAERMRRIMQEGITLPFIEVKGSRLDGASIEVETMGLPIIYQGQPAAQVIVRDITERKRAEAALRHSEERYRALYDNNTSMYFTVDEEGKVLSVNRFGAEQLGYAIEELVGQPVLQIFYEKDKTAVRQKFAECLRNSGQVHSWEFRKVRKDGSILWVQEAARAVRDAGGQTVVLIVCDDITARKQTEEALQESEARYRLLADNSLDLIGFLDLQGNILYASPSHFQVLGYAPEVLVHNNVFEVIHPDDAQQSLAAVNDLLASGASQTIEIRLRKKSGSWLEVEAILSIIAGQAEARQGILLSARDISGRKRAEEQLRQYTAELEKMVEARAQRIHELEKQRAESEKLAATGRMAARIAHEINNPLGMIQTAFHLVGSAVSKEHRHHHYVGKIEKEIDRIAQIVRQMLDLHKPHQESPKAFRADEAIREVIALTKPKFHERNLYCEQELQRAQKTITLPENLLRQVLYNVMLNAVEASPQGGRVRIVAEIAANRLQIAVIDHGEGIPEEIRSRIFEPFFTTKSNGSTGGMGLGLSICKSLIEAMNGSIELESEPGEGTICRIAIPLDENENHV